MKVGHRFLDPFKTWATVGEDRPTHSPISSPSLKDVYHQRYQSDHPESGKIWWGTKTTIHYLFSFDFHSTTWEFWAESQQNYLGFVISYAGDGSFDGGAH